VVRRVSRQTDELAYCEICESEEPADRA